MTNINLSINFASPYEYYILKGNKLYSLRSMITTQKYIYTCIYIYMSVCVYECQCVRMYVCTTQVVAMLIQLGQLRNFIFIRKYITYKTIQV